MYFIFLKYITKICPIIDVTHISRCYKAQWGPLPPTHTQTETQPDDPTFLFPQSVPIGTSDHHP